MNMAGRLRRRSVRSPGSPGSSGSLPERYAASKWGDAPPGSALPPPPTHWRRDGRCRPETDRAAPLKLLLNVA